MPMMIVRTAALDSSSMNAARANGDGRAASPTLPPPVSVCTYCLVSDTLSGVVSPRRTVMSVM